MTVPKLVGMQNREAQSRLFAVGLRWAYGGNRKRVYSQVPAPNTKSTRDDWIVHRDPAPGDVVERGSVVLLRHARSSDLGLIHGLVSPLYRVDLK